MLVSKATLLLPLGKLIKVFFSNEYDSELRLGELAIITYTIRVDRLRLGISRLWEPASPHGESADHAKELWNYQPWG